MQFFQVKISNDVFTSPKSMQALARRMATLDLNIMGPCPRSKFIEINNRMKLEAVTKALGIDVNLIVSVQMTETSFEPPAKRKRTTSAVELSNLSTAQRATNLLERGCFPLFQPARREWTEEKTISLKSGEISLLWPPSGWKNLCGDSKLLQWEVAAYKLCEATRDPATMVTVNRSDLLDRFNFLALPGTSCHHIPRSQKETAKSRFFTYERLRKLAVGEASQEDSVKWLQILECGAMMRDTSEDVIMDQLKDIPLRLQESS